jgi:hypothetical protein
MSELKPLNWTPKAGVGYSVARRADGGMNLTFTDMAEATMADWREFAFEHLLGSDRLTRNLYDVRQVSEIPERAIKMAAEVNSDPSSRNIRVAVVVASEKIKQEILTVTAASIGSGSLLKIFSSMDEAEAWISRPFDQPA